jgi:tRNA(fMet)-specific endonuclease VapC
MVAMRYMLDTNICIYLMHHQPPEVMKRFNELRFGEAVMSAITLAELRFGVECQPETRAHNGRALDALLTDVPAITFNEDAATSYGILRTAVRSRQRDALDRLIAAHAVSLGCVLVTNNEADFKDYPGLIVENWVAANAH